MRHPAPRGLHTSLMIVSLACSLLPREAWSQEPTSPRHWFNEGKRTGVAGHADSSLRFFTRAADEAHARGEEALAVAAARGRADVWLVLRGCADSALVILREAQASAPPGDRSAAEALLRLLASRGDVAAARATLVAAFSDLGGVGRTITRESITYLRGRAVVERAEGHESAALSTFNEALIIAARLHEGDASDSTDIHAVGEVTTENAWVLYDLAQLRAQAKSPSIRSARESARLMGLLIAAWDVVDDPRATPFPTVRLGDRLILRAEKCRREGTSCPVPKPTRNCG